jgi:hypothetical protein
MAVALAVMESKFSITMRGKKCAVDLQIHRTLETANSNHVMAHEMIQGSCVMAIVAIDTQSTVRDFRNIITKERQMIMVMMMMWNSRRPWQGEIGWEREKEKEIDRHHKIANLWEILRTDKWEDRQDMQGVDVSLIELL